MLVLFFSSTYYIDCVLVICYNIYIYIYIYIYIFFFPLCSTSSCFQRSATFDLFTSLYILRLQLSFEVSFN